MKIIKYERSKKNKYKVYLEDGEFVELYEDIILKHELLFKKNITDIEKIKKENDDYKLYIKTLEYINKRIRCESEIRIYLKKYTSDSNLIDEIVKKLYDKKLLDDALYIKSYINDKINFTNDGPIKIKKNLTDLEIDTFLIDDLLLIFDEKLELERIENYVNKNLKTNKKSLYLFKQKMFINLVNLGYNRDTIMSFLDKINFSESNLKEKEEDKLRKKYSKKYEGKELDYFIKRKLYEKGFRD
ncbi:MAG: RecX family transcriptional regulator [Bacilli bacterium]|nr:RecX family transcriptional regulator [Bacilli bacterium]